MQHNMPGRFMKLRDKINKLNKYKTKNMFPQSCTKKDN